MDKTRAWPAWPEEEWEVAGRLALVTTAGATHWSAAITARCQALAAELRRRLGSGTPLAPEVRRPLEPWLGRDTSGTLVHYGRLPGQLAAALGAEALAAGRHVLGAAHRLDAGTRQGAALLGHELTHAAPPVAAISTPTPPAHASPAGASGDAVQRAQGSGTDGEVNGEAAAAGVERALLRAPGESRTGLPPLDLDRLAERVYRRLLEAALLERERAGLA